MRVQQIELSTFCRQEDVARSMQDKIDWIALSLLRCWGHMWAHCWAMATHVINDWITLTHRVNSLKRDCVIWRCAFAGQAAEDGSLEKILQANPRSRQETDSFCFVPVNIKPCQANVLSPHLLLALFLIRSHQKNFARRQLACWHRLGTP